MKRYIANAGLVAGVIICATPVKSHHSFAMFDGGKTITVTGTVKEFQWVNPHVLIWVEVNDARNAQPIVWSIEASSPGNLRRQGWKQDSLKPGDRVEVIGNPLRDGNPGAGFLSLKILDTGEILGWKFPTPPKE
jgi:Family of unknown function (DUF6152)